MLGLEKIEHIGIAVKNLEASNLLYAQILNTPCYKMEEVASEHTGDAGGIGSNGAGGACASEVFDGPGKRIIAVDPFGGIADCFRTDDSPGGDPD